MAKGKKYDGPKPEEVLVQDLIDLMQTDQTPWRREWNQVNSHHINFLTNHRYSGSNIVLLEFGLCMRNASLPFWCGAAEARKNGVMPKKGSRSVRIIRPQLNRIEEETETGEVNEKTWTSFKVVPVFNVCDLQGENLEALIQKAKQDNHIDDGRVLSDAQRIQSAEEHLSRWPVKVVHQGDRAFYAMNTDSIHLPEFETFHTPESYYSTRAHECVHSTGHHSRLKRDMSGDMRTKQYAYEELVAELGSLLLCKKLCIGSNVSNHASYLKNWIQMLQEKPRILFTALSDARKAVDMIVEKIETQEEEAVDLELVPV